MQHLKEIVLPKLMLKRLKKKKGSCKREFIE